MIETSEREWQEHREKLNEIRKKLEELLRDVVNEIEWMIG